MSYQLGFVKDRAQKNFLSTMPTALRKTDVVPAIRLLLCLQEYGCTAMTVPIPDKRPGIWSALTNAKCVSAKERWKMGTTTLKKGGIPSIKYLKDLQEVRSLSFVYR